MSNFAGQGIWVLPLWCEFRPRPGEGHIVTLHFPTSWDKLCYFCWGRATHSVCFQLYALCIAGRCWIPVLPRNYTIKHNTKKAAPIPQKAPLYQMRTVRQLKTTAHASYRARAWCWLAILHTPCSALSDLVWQFSPAPCYTVLGGYSQ